MLSCNHFQARQANSDRTSFSGGASFSSLVYEDPLTQWHEILSLNARNYKLSLW